MPVRLFLLLQLTYLSASVLGQPPPKMTAPQQEQVEISLTDLERRCKKMLAQQSSIHDATVALHRVIEGTVDKKPRQQDREMALQLAAKEKEIIAEATKAIDLLQAAGAAVAFPEVFQQVRDDMKIVERRLTNCDVGRNIQVLQKDIIETFREMTQALGKNESRHTEVRSALPHLFLIEAAALTSGIQKDSRAIS